jgi:hypothetical protein
LLNCLIPRIDFAVVQRGEVFLYFHSVFSNQPAAWSRMYSGVRWVYSIGVDFRLIRKVILLL